MDLVTFDLRAQAEAEKTGEFVLGAKETGSHACYMIYGSLKPGEKGRLVKPGVGHEEIILAARGNIEITGTVNGTLRQGSAFHVAGDDECRLENRGSSEAVYIVAGGHSAGGHGHPH